jgi:cold shock CspA family protein
MSAERKQIAKWGFGMAPISQRMRERYDNAVHHLRELIEGNLTMQELTPDLISEAKGMMNRCVKEDQWDWFSVYTEFGSPPRKMLRNIASDLVVFRRAAIAEDLQEYSSALQRLINRNVLQILHVYQNHIASQTYSEGAGWIYILSTRENRNILKIGRTDRTVSDRVKEINSATGVVIPWAARRVFRVRNATEAESEIHRRLAEFRIRNDREFFDLDIEEAVKVIRQYLEESDQKDRLRGVISWYDKDKCYGFISCEGQPDAFLHRSQLSKEDHAKAEKGMEVTFLVGRNPKGECALNVELVLADSP